MAKKAILPDEDASVSAPPGAPTPIGTGAAPRAIANPGISYRKRYRNVNRRGNLLGPFHLRYGRGSEQFTNAIILPTPSGVAATPGSLSAMVAWPLQVGADLIELGKSPDGATGWIVISALIPGKSTSWFVGSLVAGTPVFFRIRSNNEVGWTGYSPASASVTPLP